MPEGAVRVLGDLEAEEEEHDEPALGLRQIVDRYYALLYVRGRHR